MARLCFLPLPVCLLALGVQAGCSSKEFTDSTGSGASSGSGGGSSGGSGGSGGSSGDADVSGSYTVAVTNRQNTCMSVMNWTEGAQTADIPVTLTMPGPDGAEAGGRIEGAAGLYIALVIGTAAMEGDVQGNDVTLTAYGTKPYTEGNCTFTLNATMEGTLTGNALQGTITYQPAISSNPDCEAFDCEAVQEFSGTRPPPA